MNDDVQAQLDDFARQLAALNTRFEALQRRVSFQTTATAPATAPPVTPARPTRPRLYPPPPASAAEPPVRPPRPSVPQWTPPPPRPPRAPRARPQLPKIEVDLLGPRALAIAGGIVTLLGIIFFFVLAVNKGWIGHTARVSLGGVAATIVFAAGLELKRRYGTTYSTLAAIGAGIAGGYATLLSAAALYHMLSDWTALVAAGGIAAVGLATSLAWRSEIVAGIGLLGALLVPATIEVQGGTSVLATSFVAIVFAVLAAVCVRLGWHKLLVAGGLASVAQLLVLVFADRYEHHSPASVLAVVSVFFALYAATGIARHLRLAPASLDGIATMFLLAGGLATAGSLARLLPAGQQQGVALLILGLVYAAPGVVFFRREKTRNLSALLTFATFTLLAVGFAVLLHGNAVTYAWSAEALGLAWLARRVREIRFQLWSAVYLVLALIHVLAIDARPRELFTATKHAASGAPAAAALAAAMAVFAFYAGRWERKTTERKGLSAILSAVLDYWAAVGPRLRIAAGWGALAFATYAASLGTVALFTRYDWAWVAVAGLWMGVGLGALALALGRLRQLELGALVWLGISAAALALRAVSLDSAPRAWSIVVVAVGLFAASVAYQLVPRTVRPQQRDVSAFAGLAAVALSLAGGAALLSNHPLAYAWTAEAVTLVALARLLAAPHLRALALAPLLCAALHSLIVDAPPRQLLDHVGHPAHGVLTAVGVAFAALVSTLIPAGEPRAYAAFAPGLDAFERAAQPIRVGLRWLALAFATYALSLGVVWVMSSFAWATVANAGLWMAIGLTVLALGFRRGIAHLRLGGLVWLGATGLVALTQALRVLAGDPRAAVFAIGAVAALAASFTYGMSRHEGVDRGTVMSPPIALLALCLFLYPTGYRLEDRWAGAALLGLAALYAALSALLGWRKSRNPSTWYWAVAVGLAAFADPMLLHGTYAVLGWAGLGVAIAWLARRVREPRLHLGATVLVALAVAQAFVFQAPPTHLFLARVHPAYGTASIFIAAAALAALAYFARGERHRLMALRTAPWWLAGGIAVYGLSLVILEVVEWISRTRLDTEFQRGQTGVSAFWGLLGLALLYVGLKRRWRSLRIAGLAFFPISLAKIFLYDLPSLSSVTRALSFLAVGAVLLLGGFFYQRLMADRDEPLGRRS